jgi:thioester reductase-like protein
VTTWFVTGATGVVGGELVPRLAALPGARLRLLVRARDDAEATARLEALLPWWGLPLQALRSGRIAAVRGDITQPRLGLALPAWERLAAEVSHIVHSAASVKLNMSEAQARESAVEPARSIVELARRCSAGGGLRKLDVVSTVGVWGTTPGVLPEQPLRHVAAFHNTYEQAKFEAEQVLWSLGADLPLTVHRPSMVVGQRGSGRVLHFQVFYHLCEFLSGVRTRGVVPDLGERRLDTVPVDWVADMIVWSSARATAPPRVLHLCAGPGDSLPLEALRLRVRTHWQAHGLALPRAHRIDRRCLQRWLPVVGLLGGARARRALRALPPLLSYLEEQQGFDNTRSTAVAAQAGLPAAPPESYLDAVLDYYLAHRGSGTR